VSAGTGTRALVRQLSLPGGLRMALITLESPDGSANRLDRTALESLRTALRAARGQQGDAVAITGKPGSFATGDPLDPAAHLPGGPGPTVDFAFVNADADAAGVGLALRASHRTVCTVARLHLAADRPAVSGVAAFDAGFAGALLEPADFLERSLVFAADVLTGRIPATSDPGSPVRRVCRGGLGG
jgi:hypothetical protein